MGSDTPYFRHWYGPSPVMLLGLLILIQRTSGFDLYAVFDPLIAKSQAILLGNKLIRWISVSDNKQHCP